MVTSVDFEDREVGASPLQSIWLKLRHRMVLIVALTLLFGGVLSVAGQLIPPTYKAAASVIVDSQTPRTIAGLTPDQPFTDNTIGTEISILESRELFEKVVDQLNLTTDPEFNKSLKPSFIDQWKKTVMDEIKARLASVFPPPPRPRASTQHYDTVEELRSKVKYVPVPLSRVIDIVVSSNSPERAAQIANTISDVYIEHHRDIGLEVATRADRFLSDQLTQMKKMALDASDAEENYRIENNLMLGGHTGGGKDTTLAQEQASSINEQLMQAQNRLQQLQATQAASKVGNPEQSTAVLASPTMARLRDMEALISGKRNELLAKYGPNSQVLDPINGQLGAIRANIHDEARRMVASIDTDVKTAQDTVARLKRDQAATLGNLRTSNIAQAHLDTLHTEALAAQSMYTTFLAKAKETAALRMYQDTPVRSVSKAAVPV